MYHGIDGCSSSIYYAKKIDAVARMSIYKSSSTPSMQSTAMFIGDSVVVDVLNPVLCLIFTALFL